MAAPKEIIIVILDVGRKMNNPYKDGTTPMDSALKSVNLLVQQKLLFGKKDELGLILFGTEETKNDLADDGYENIVVASEIKIPDLALLKYVDKIEPGGSSGDLIDALIVAMDLLINHHAKNTQKRIFLVTDAASPCNADDVPILVQKFKELEVKLNVIGVDFDEYDEDGTQLSQSGKPKTQLKYFKNTEFRKNFFKSLISSKKKEKNEEIVRKMIEKINGVIIPVNQALEIMSWFRSKSSTTRTTWRGLIEISPLVKIGVWGYAKTAEQKFPSLKKVSAFAQQGADPGTMAVIYSRSYVNALDPDQELDKGDIIKGYKYGKSLVPFSGIDEAVLKYTAPERCLKLIGFTDSRNVPRQNFLGPSEYFLPDVNDVHSSQALSSLIHALAETESVAIVRYVKRANSNPHLGVLTPHIKADYECLYYNKLPFAEDLRHYQFPPLESDKVEKKNLIPNNEQKKAAENLIDQFDLMDAGIDENGENMEALKSKHLCNPALQHFYQCVQNRALNPESRALPELDPIIASYANPDKNLFQDAKPILKQFKNAFPLKKTEVAEKTQRRWWSDMMNEEDIKLDSYVPDKAAKKRKFNENGDNDFGDFSMENLISTGINEIGSVTPVSDFNDMISRKDVDLVDKAIEQMKKRINIFVINSIGKQYYEKALSCLNALRAGCIQETEVDTFNKYLKEIRNLFENKRRNDFWELIRDNKISLINSEESEHSVISVEESLQFLEGRLESDDEDIVMDEEPKPKDSDADDLLNMIE